MKKYIRNTAFVLGILAAFSCIHDEEFVEVDDLGVPKSEIKLKVEGGTEVVKVYTNKHTTAKFIEYCDWARLKTSSIDRDGDFVVEYDQNTRYPRYAKIEFTTSTRRDTCVLQQYGALEEKFILQKSVITTYRSEKEEVEVDIVSANTDYDLFVRYIDGYGWMKVSRNEGKLLIETNPNDGEMREAEILLSWIDGWGETHQKTLVFRQTGEEISLVKKSFEEIRALVGQESEWTPSGDFYIEGYVINDKNENAGECYMEVMDRIDYDSNETTVYFEDENADYGFRLVCISPNANTFTKNTKVKLRLDGCKILKSVNPERYDIIEVSKDNIFASEYAAKESVPVKELSIDELNDSHIYTYVTLKDCELPIRKGSLTPVNEGYTMACQSNRIAKFPSLVRDKKGGSIYMYTNMTCPYRRDGQILPYGSGNISGVIVSEVFRPFGDDIGKYQIRHLSREEIALAKTMEDNSFSKLLAEFRFIKIEDLNTEDAVGFPKGAITPTYGTNAWLTHTGSGTNTDNAPVKTDKKNYTKCTPYYDFSYLGPYLAPKKGEKNGERTYGFGIMLEDGTDYGVSLPQLRDGQTVNEDGKGSSFNTMAWRSGQFTKYYTGEICNGWVVCFSTSGIQTDVLSAQVSMFNSSTGAPTEWRAQYHVPENVDSSLDELWDSSWTTIKEFTTPDIVINSNTQLTQSPGYKPVDIPLPAAELCNKEKVYVRIIPKSLATGGANAMNYFAVRYNK